MNTLNDLIPTTSIDSPKRKYVILPNILSALECKTLQDFIISNPLETATYSKADAIKSKDLHQGAFIEKRKGLSLTFEDLPFTIFHRIKRAFHKSNHTLKIQYSSIINHLRVNSYSPTEYLDWHYDTYYNSFKLTGILQLTQSYTGGEFEILSTLSLTSRKFKTGSMLIFPSYLAHRINPVISGRRVTISAFTLGDAFR
jgi:hypothetical protein